jgi:pyrroline-5-carboxylate reductase
LGGYALRSASKDESDRASSISVGFIGCGTIASAIAQGIATQNVVPVESIVVSRRSESKSQTLKEKFSKLVTIQDDNQEILNACDIVFLCVLPEQTQSAMETLQFHPNKHSLVSLVVRRSQQNLFSYT